MKKRHVYLVIQDEREWPCKSHNDTQRHVLGVFSSRAKANRHLEACKVSRIERGFNEVRDTRYNIEHMHGTARCAYLAKPDKSITSELIIERKTIA